MMGEAGYVIDRVGVALVIFALATEAVRPVLRRPALRVVAGLIAVASAAMITVSHRSLFDWCLSAIDRLSAPGFLVVALLAINGVFGISFKDIPEYRFGAGLLAVVGLVLYPSAVGLIDYDVYTWGYAGFLLPAIVTAIIVCAAWRRYWWIVVALDVGIAGFLLSLGRSMNLWDYIIDPVACVIGVFSWIVILGFALRGTIGVFKTPQPSGETPISS